MKSEPAVLRVVTQPRSLVVPGGASAVADDGMATMIAATVSATELFDAPTVLAGVRSTWEPLVVRIRRLVPIEPAARQLVGPQSQPIDSFTAATA